MTAHQMRVLYDNHIFNVQSYGGISRYIYELITGVSRSKEIQVAFSVHYSSNSYLLAARELYGVKSMPKKGTPFRGFIASRQRSANYKAFRQAAERGNFDIYHPTYHDEYILQSLPDCPYVLTIHDMIDEIYPELFPGAAALSAAKQELAKKAARIIAVSENTKKDLMRIWELPSERIHVVHLAQSVGAATDHKPSLPEKYILFVGNRGLYKNFKLFAESIARLLVKDRQLFLVAAGSKPFQNDELRHLGQLGILTQVRHIPFHTDGQLAEIYRNALCFVLPSRYEGFGIPTLEAFACGCPVLLSKSSSLTEVGGDAVEYFNPENPESMYDAVSRIVRDTALRKDLVNKGRERLRMFSWKKVCDQTLDVYRMAACNSIA